LQVNDGLAQGHVRYLAFRLEQLAPTASAAAH
jgi:hypothetical protein